MERREAVFALEDELIRCAHLTKLAACLMDDLLDGFFIYGASSKAGLPIEIPRSLYAPAAAKAEIIGELLRRQFEILDRILDD